MQLAFSTNAYLNFSFAEAIRRLAAIGYRGATSQRQRLTIQADGTALAKFRLLLGCQDGGHTGAAIATAPHRPKLEADGSFYYSESGTADFVRLLAVSASVMESIGAAR